jgi:DNA polymerase-3 subunit alpha
MIQYHISNNLTDCVKDSSRFQDLNDEEHILLYDEVLNATLQGVHDNLVSKVGTKSENKTSSLLLWVIGLTDDKPTDRIAIKSEGSYPDIDSDYSKLNRDKVIEYTKEKYGHDKVCQVVTFGTLGAKGAIRSAARALGYTVADGDYVAKLISNEPDITIAISIDSNPLLKDIIDKKEEPYYHILGIAQKLEGLPNASGVHASALIISDKPTYEYVPLMISKKEGGGITTQYEYKDAEANFLIKWDYLGLKTLDVIHETIKLIYKNKKVLIDADTIDVNDPSIYKLLNDGHNACIFQFESSVFQSAVFKVRPNSIHDLSAITSLNRPGPMQNGLLDQYIAAKNEGRLYEYGLADRKLIDKVQDICKDCYSIMTYQEYVIKCFSEIAGFNEIESDNSRRALGKKDAVLLEKLGKQFVEGGSKNGYMEEDLKKLFTIIELYSGYSFNASHAYAYSHITAQTAYLSANYPLEFFTAALTIDADNTDDVRRYITALKNRNITITAPNINKSKSGFVITDDAIVFGLSAIKGVGKAITDKLIKGRPKTGYPSFGEFVIKNISLLNKKILESYIKAGVFVDFGYSKNTLLKSMDNILDLILELKSNNKSTMLDVLGVDFGYFIEACLIDYSDKPDSVYYEVDAIGMYITKHPFDDFVVDKRQLQTIDMIKEVDEDIDNYRVKTVGVVTNIGIRKTKSKTNMCDFLLTDTTSSIRVVVFPTVYNQFMAEIEEGRIAFLNGFVKYDNDERVLYPREIARYGSNSIGLMRKVSSNVVIPKKTEDDIIIHRVGKLQFKLEKK